MEEICLNWTNRRNDAWTLYDDAIQQLEQGHIRNAAEKAWGATIAVPPMPSSWPARGSCPGPPSMTSMRPGSLTAEVGQARSLVGRYYSESASYTECFYNGICHPVHTERRIREDGDYIRDAEALAGS